VSVRAAILSLVTKSANDVAIVLAEAIAGDESAFVEQMNVKARDIGMVKTEFRNPSSLHDPAQSTTARDMTILARALMHSIPTEYAYFSVIEFEYSGQTYTNHNRMLSNYAGTDGIKTGYVRAAGFHLAASVHRQGHHLVGVIMGSRSAKARDLKMIYLLESAFSRLRPVEAGIAPNRADQMRAGIALQ
jgi:D-alanyl-D-alanine carboxypeptidase